MSIRRFWFEFTEDYDGPLPKGLKLGCGISGYDYDDALDIAKQVIFKGKCLPALSKEIVDVNISDLDQNHVRPNMGDVLRRGVWFPLGYS